ncbi:MAG: hypothetical protein PUF72_10785 [Clostridiales bacterium]|nr:hypothetical protein [Clostridiales bacterium]
MIDLINYVDENEYDVLWRIILKFVKETPPYADEIEAIERGEEEYKNGQIYSHEDVWA